MKRILLFVMLFGGLIALIVGCLSAYSLFNGVRKEYEYSANTSSPNQVIQLDMYRQLAKVDQEGANTDKTLAEADAIIRESQTARVLAEAEAYKIRAEADAIKKAAEQSATQPKVDTSREDVIRSDQMKKLENGSIAAIVLTLVGGVLFTAALKLRGA